MSAQVAETIFEECDAIMTAQKQLSPYGARIAAKLVDIFAKPCFNEVQLFQIAKPFAAYPNHKPMHAHGLQGHARIHNNRKKFSPTAHHLPPGLQRKTVIGAHAMINPGTRIVNGILNKITETSFAYLINQLIHVPNIAEADLVTFVFEKAISDKSQMQVMTKCIKKLHDIHAKPVQDAALALYESFKNTLPTQLEFFRDNHIEQNHDYNALCALLKYRTKFLNTILLICILQKQGFVQALPPTDQKTLLELLTVPLLESIDATNAVNALNAFNSVNVGVIDILVHAIQEFCSVFPNAKSKIKEIYTTNNLEIKLNNKCRFKLIGLFEKCTST